MSIQWMAEPDLVASRRPTARRIMVGLLVGSTRKMPFNKSATISRRYVANDGNRAELTNHNASGSLPRHDNITGWVRFNP